MVELQLEGVLRPGGGSKPAASSAAGSHQAGDMGLQITGFDGHFWVKPGNGWLVLNAEACGSGAAEAALG